MVQKRTRPLPVARQRASGVVIAGASDNSKPSTSSRRFQGGKTLRSLADPAILDMLNRPIDPVEPDDGGDHV